MCMNSLDRQNLKSFSKKQLIRIILSEENLELFDKQLEVIKIQGKQLKNQESMINNLEKILNNQEKIIDSQTELVKQLTKKIQSLEKDSSNSSKPPASDTNNKPKKNQSLREKSGKKPGGQNGHKGRTREQTKNPDKTIAHRPDNCNHCQQFPIFSKTP